MKKKDKPPISIILPEEKYTLGVSCSFYSFFTLFSFSLGIYSSLLLMVSSDAPNYRIVLILGLFSFFLTILQKIKIIPVRFLASVLPYAFILYLYRKRFFCKEILFYIDFKYFFKRNTLQLLRQPQKRQI